MAAILRVAVDTLQVVAPVEADLEKPPLLRTVFSEQSLRRCVPIALFVGTVLSLVNQWPAISNAHLTWKIATRIVVNYIVPFCVSSSGFFLSQRAVWKTKRLAAAE